MIELKHFLTLLVAGFFGSLIRLILRPEGSWQRWVSRFAVGMTSAVFLGGLTGHLICKWFVITEPHEMIWAVSAAGFIIGSTAEQVMAALQDRLLAGIREGDEEEDRLSQEEEEELHYYRTMERRKRELEDRE